MVDLKIEDITGKGKKMLKMPVALTGKANCIALGKEKPLEMVNTKFTSFIKRD